MGSTSFDRKAARALLVERGMTLLAADEFLMRSLLTATEAATVLGVKNSRAARDTLRRWGVKPTSRGPGRTGENTYPAGLVWQHQQNRPGRGWRKGRFALDEKDNVMHTAAKPTPDTSEAWYSNHQEVVALASVLVDADWLNTPHDVIDFFSEPWKWDSQHKMWAAAGRPQSPSPDDLAQARLLGHGTTRQELKRRYQDDTARWQALTESLDTAADAPDEPDAPTADTASNIRPLTRPDKNRDRS